MRRTRNAVWVQTHRGFESLPIRQTSLIANYLKTSYVFSMAIKLTERDVTDHELEHMRLGFEDFERSMGVKLHVQARYSFVAVDGQNFVGAISALRNGTWFYITDLFIEKAYRGRKLGAQLLTALEAKARDIGVSNLYAWTASYEAPIFYRKMGYSVFCEMEHYYAGGHSRIGVKKKLGVTGSIPLVFSGRLNIES